MCMCVAHWNIFMVNKRDLQKNTKKTHTKNLSCKGLYINVNIFMSVQTIHFLRPLPPKKSTHQHFLSAKNPHENKNQAKKLKVHGKNVDFHRQ